MPDSNHSVTRICWTLSMPRYEWIDITGVCPSESTGDKLNCAERT